MTPLAARMDTFEMNGYLLAGAEYWPYVGRDDIKYPEEVLWGFYPAKGEIAMKRRTAAPLAASSGMSSTPAFPGITR